jgi:probable HAF family extracellular repeat protein
MMFASRRTRTASRFTCVVLIVLVASLLTFSPGARAQTAPLLVDLGTLGGRISNAIAVNASGHIVGNSETATGAFHAFLWTPNGGMVDLGTLGGATSSARAINALGHVAGSSQTGNGDTHAFFWTPLTGMIDLGTLPGSSSSEAAALNDSNQVVGSNIQGSVPFGTRTHGFVWSPEGGMVDIGTLRGLASSVPVAINARGEVVGVSGQPFVSALAFLWTAKDGMTELGVLPGAEQSGASDVNDAGQVVGLSNVNNSAGSNFIHAFSWTAGGGMIDLGTVPGFDQARANRVSVRGQVVGQFAHSPDPPVHAFSWTAENGLVELGTLGGPFSAATAVNAKGQVVGWSTPAPNPIGVPFPPSHAFVWTAATGMVDLGTLGGSESAATALNDRGDVVGFSKTPTGDTHATLWIARVPDAPPERLVVHDVQASSELTFSLEASHAADGDPFSRWSSEFSDAQFIQVDLGQDTAFDRIVLRWESARAAEYEIQGSSDGETWSALRRVTASGNVDDLFDVGASARYVRMQGFRRATPWGYSLFEFEVYRDGVNIAAGRAMTASSTERMVFPSTSAVDGDPSTRWSSEFADAQWLAVDLGINVRLDRVVLKWEEAYGADYDLLVSNDALSWTSVRTVTNADGGVDELTDLTADGRYVGLLLHRRGTPWGFSLWGFEAYGSPAGIAP